MMLAEKVKYECNSKIIRFDNENIGNNKVKSDIRKFNRNKNVIPFHKNKENALGSEVDFMDWQEKYIEKLDQDISDIKSEVKGMEDKIGNRIDSKLEEFRNEMRHLDNQRVEDMREIRASLDSTNKHVQGMVSSVHSIAIATVIGVAAMVISVLGIWYSISNNQAEISNQLQQQSIQIQEIQKTQNK